MSKTRIAAVALLAMGLSSMAAHAQAWPEKPVKLMVLSAPGGSPDVAARAISERLGKTTGQRFIVENKVGAGGIPGWSALKDSAPDGYTFALVPASAYVLTPHLFKDVPVDMNRDFVPAAFAGTTPIVVAVKKDSPYRTFEDLLKASRASNGKTAVATTLINSLPHLLGELSNKRADARFHIVPFSTSPAGVTAILSGEVVAMIDGYPSFEGMMRSGDVRLLATFSSERMANNRSIPTVSEAVNGLSATGWFAIFAPKGTPPEILEKFRKAVDEATSNEDVSRRMVSLSIFPERMDADELGKFLKKEQDFWAAAVSTAGAKTQ